MLSHTRNNVWPLWFRLIYLVNYDSPSQSPSLGRFWYSPTANFQSIFQLECSDVIVRSQHMEVLIVWFL